MKNILFSIIIPHYNAPSQLERALASLHGQLYDSWECIVVDDGSSEETYRKLVQLENEKIVIYRLDENRGPSAARNLGAKQAQGDYFCFLDCDDEFLPHHLKILNEKIEAEGRPEAVFRSLLITERDGQMEYEKLPSWKLPISYFIRHHAGLHTLCVSKKIALELPFPEAFRYWEDYHFTIRAMQHYPLFQLPHHTALYHASYSSSSFKNYYELKERVQQQLNCIDDLERELGGFSDINLELEHARLRSWINFAENMYMEGKYDWARGLLRDSRGHSATWRLKFRILKLKLRLERRR